MRPEEHLSKFITVYHTALKDLQTGKHAAVHLPKITAMMLELDEMIREVESSGGRTKGYAAIKNELVDLQEKIKLAAAKASKEIIA